MTTRYYVETRNPPPNHDMLSVTEHYDREEAIELARRVHGRVWGQSHESIRVLVPTEEEAHDPHEARTPEEAGEHEREEDRLGRHGFDWRP